MTTLINPERMYIRSIPQAFSGTVADLTSGVWIHALPFTEIEHPVYGDVTLTPDIADKMIANFRDNVFGQEVPINYEHFGMDPAKGYKAAGWVQDMETRSDGLWWNVKWTSEAATEILDKAWQYFSAEYYDVYPDSEGTLHTYVVNGGALTTRPFFKGMVPINFSELTATDGHVTSEVADWEHGEPGSGQPREDVDTDEPGQGTRSDSPEIEVEDSMEEFLKQLREALGLTEDADEQKVLVALSEMVAEVKPLREALDSATTAKTFSEQYPEQAARMAKLEIADRINKANAFSERYAKARLTEEEGDDKKETPFGFSANTVEKIKEAHLAFSENALTEDDFAGVLDSIMNTGLVDYSERGTAREEEKKEKGSPVKAFSEAVAKLQTDDKLSYPEALRLAAEQNPELAQAYRNEMAEARR